MLTETLIKGQLVELLVQAELIRYGFDISIPNYNASRYDLIADTGEQLLRIQIKKSLGKNEGSFSFDGFSQNVRASENKAKRKYTKEEIDYFATVWKNKTYLIPVEEVSYSKTLYENDETYLAKNVLRKFHRLSDDELYNYSEKKKGKCLKCGAEIQSASTLCRKCKNLSERKVERPNREELKKLIYENSFSALGRKFGVSDNAIRKWCAQEKLPYKRADIRKYSLEDWNKI